MDPTTRLRIEIETLHELLPDLDYYKILQLDPSCEQSAIGDQYRDESRRLHPDRMRMIEDEDIRRRGNELYQFVNEAYRYLKEPEERARYDQLLSTGVIRMTDDAKAGAQADKRSNDPEAAATNAKSEKYWKMALRDMKDKSWKSAVMNIKFALTFEPGNDVFKEHLVIAEEAFKEEDAKREKNPYKLRIM
jgi:curved DNA-binding protein CbpA